MLNYGILVSQLQERLRRLQEPCLVSVGCQTDEPVFEALSHSPLPLSPVQEPRVPEKADDDLRSSPLREEEHRAEPSPRVVPEVDARRDEPAVAGPELSRPAQEPVRPAQEPVRPAQEPVRPAQEPVRPAQEAVRPAPEPARPAPEPARRQPPPQRPEAVRPAMPEPVRVGPPPAAEEGAERAQEAPPEPPAAPVQSSSQEAAAPPEVAPSAATIARKTARKRPSSVLREEPDRLLWTDRPYPSWPRPPPEEALEAIEVPTWRVRTVATAYTMEGTEDLDDEVFLKRHEKPERDERRRKKWDMQRMREEQQMERLRRKQLRSQPEERPPACPRSFCGHLRNVHRIEVVEALPVVAFGQPLPDLEPEEFSVPWLRSRQWEQARTVDRGCLKNQLCAGSQSSPQGLRPDESRVPGLSPWAQELALTMLASRQAVVLPRWDTADPTWAPCTTNTTMHVRFPLPLGQDGNERIKWTALPATSRTYRSSWLPRSWNVGLWERLQGGGTLVDLLPWVAREQ
ncbi:hypothetical protein V5799_024338 [Amblyomma americanum]|uniref:PEHE domain-containing protein n=1 Tax=Amblyomma americanum TaxID=6943 RepID=A0AAQ4ECU7_AMBAM